MSDENTTAVVQRFLGDLAADTPVEPVIRQLLDRVVVRLQWICGTLLHRDYPRLTRSPLNLQTDKGYRLRDQTLRDRRSLDGR